MAIANNTLSICSKEVRQFGDLYCLNDLHKASGGSKTHQPSNFIRLQVTQDLIKEISCSSDVRNVIKVIPKVGTYICKELVYSYAMWISPKFHLIVIRAFDTMSNQKAIGVPAVVSFPPGEGRYLVYIDRDGKSYTKNLESHSVVNADAVDALNRDLLTLGKAFDEVRERLLVLSGDRGLSTVEQPLKISLNG